MEGAVNGKKIVGTVSGNYSLKGGAIATVFGKDGESAYQIALNNGFRGTEEEWLASLKGEKGEDGDVAATIKGFFTLSVDKEGNLWVFAEENAVPNFEYNSTTGELYIVQEE